MAHVGNPGFNAAAITPSDTVNLGSPTRSIYVGVTGNLTVLMYGGQVVTFNNVPVGIFPIQVLRVNATGTTATNLVALW